MWDDVLKSCNQAAKILGKELTEQDTPATWCELLRLHSDLWDQVHFKKASQGFIGNSVKKASQTK